MSDRLVRFFGDSCQEIEALPESVRWTVQRVIFHLLDEPVPTLADPFPEQDPLPGAYELHLPSDGVTIWYVVAVPRAGDHQHPAGAPGYLAGRAGRSREDYHDRWQLELRRGGRSGSRRASSGACVFEGTRLAIYLRAGQSSSRPVWH